MEYPPHSHHPHPRLPPSPLPLPSPTKLSLNSKCRSSSRIPADSRLHSRKHVGPGKQMYTCMLMRDGKEGRKKKASKVKQTTRQSNTAHPRQSLLLRKMSCLGWDSNPRHSTLYTLDTATKDLYSITCDRRLLSL